MTTAVSELEAARADVARLYEEARTTQDTIVSAAFESAVERYLTLLDAQAESLLVVYRRCPKCGWWTEADRCPCCGSAELSKRRYGP